MHWSVGVTISLTVQGKEHSTKAFARHYDSKECTKPFATAAMCSSSSTESSSVGCPNTLLLHSPLQSIALSPCLLYSSADSTEVTGKALRVVLTHVAIQINGAYTVPRFGTVSAFAFRLRQQLLKIFLP